MWFGRRLLAGAMVDDERKSEAIERNSILIEKKRGLFAFAE